MYFVTFTQTQENNQLKATFGDKVLYKSSFAEQQDAIIHFIEVVLPGGFTSEYGEYALILHTNECILQTCYTKNLTNHITKRFMMVTQSPTT